MKISSQWIIIKCMRILFFLVVSFLLASCFSNNDDCDPTYYCYPIPYDFGWVNVDITNDNNDSILVILYSGYVEDDYVIDSLHVTTNQFSVQLPAAERYAVEVYYQNGPTTIIALDGGRLRQRTRENCGETCYEEPNLNLDIRKL